MTTLACPGVLAELVRSAGLTLLASGHWPYSTDDVLPALPGFVDSSFSPLVAETAERCLCQAHGQRPAEPQRGERTALVLASELGDVTSAMRVADAVASGARVGPLLFFQSVPNAVAGYVAARWGLAGPMASVGSARTAVDVATLLLEDGDADEALVVAVEQSYVDSARDHAEAVLLAGPAGDRP